MWVTKNQLIIVLFCARWPTIDDRTYLRSCFLPLVFLFSFFFFFSSLRYRRPFRVFYFFSSQFPIRFPHKRLCQGRLLISLPLPYHTHTHTRTHICVSSSPQRLRSSCAACPIAVITILFFSPISLRVAADGRRQTFWRETFRNTRALLRKYLRERGAMRSLRLVCPSLVWVTVRVMTSRYLPIYVQMTKKFPFCVCWNDFEMCSIRYEYPIVIGGRELATD